MNVKYVNSDAFIWLDGSLGKYAQINGVALTIEEARDLRDRLDKALKKHT